MSWAPTAARAAFCGPFRDWQLDQHGPRSANGFPQHFFAHQRRLRRSCRATAWWWDSKGRQKELPPANSWEVEADEWDRLGEYDEQEVINAIYEEDGSPDALIQSILGLALTILLLFLVVNILLKTALVAWTLVGAAVRYSAVAFLLIAVAAFLL